jgi:hypothetical protein
MEPRKTSPRAEVKFFLLLFGLSLYLTFFKIPFPEVDDLAYKEAAYRLSQGLGLSAPGVQGVYPGSERLFAFYPPVHSFLLGGWFLAFGFSLGSSLLFSLLLCGAIALLCVRLCRGAPGDSPPKIIYGLAFVAWTLALSGIHRPDPLYVLFGLMLLWTFDKRLPCPQGDWPTHLFCVLLIALGVGTSPGMGVFMLPYFAVIFTAASGFTRKSFLLFLGDAFLGVVLALCAWAWVVRAEPQLFWDHFLHRALTLRVVGGHPHLYLFLCLPLMFFLFLAVLGWAAKDPPSPSKKALLLQLLVLSGLWIFFFFVRTKGTYLTMIHITLIVLCGKAFSHGLLTIKGLFLRRLWRGAAWSGIFLAALPFVRMAAMPLTWNSSDSYGYNGERILSQVPRGAAVLSDVQFWTLLAPGHRVYDAHFSPSMIFKSDYVLLAGSGSGRPGVARLPFSGVARQYFDRNFVRKDSTLLNVPNQLWGLPLARSRWSYRYDLYERQG